ncbi:unnamed protein product [Schistosoma mattheei]|uniref:Uncharacterized protein n=1 Tax=Schistosoma mattheei TaxID=31246 RepID=A0A183P476_9TREM|nr:unnamed protein product [Schistosoma mattheei]
MVVGSSRQETLDPDFVLFGTRQQGVPVILREPSLSDGFDPVSPSFTVSDVNTELSEPQPTSSMYSSIQSSLALNDLCPNITKSISHLEYEDTLY